jgi:hypothetical protein
MNLPSVRDGLRGDELGQRPEERRSWPGAACAVEARAACSRARRRDRTTLLMWKDCEPAILGAPGRPPLSQMTHQALGGLTLPVGSARWMISVAAAARRSD